PRRSGSADWRSGLREASRRRCDARLCNQAEPDHKARASSILRVVSNVAYQPRRALRAVGWTRLLSEPGLEGRSGSFLLIEPPSYCFQPLCGFPQSYGVWDFDPMDHIVPDPPDELDLPARIVVLDAGLFE